MIKAIAVGASTGGVAAMREIAAGLPADFPIPVLVTIHIGPHRSYLADILQDSGPLPCKQAEAGEPILGGVIYVAPPDHHLVVEAGRAELVRGPKENWARPAIDPLFRSAALEYGPELVAVVLSGKLNDGTAGLYEVKRRGGATVVQDPSDAQEPSMPRSALRHVDVDYVVPLARLPSLLVALTVERSGGARSKSASPSEASMSETASHWANPTAHVPGMRRRNVARRHRDVEPLPLPYGARIHERVACRSSACHDRSDARGRVPQPQGACGDLFRAGGEKRPCHRFGGRRVEPRRG